MLKVFIATAYFVLASSVASSDGHASDLRAQQVFVIGGGPIGSAMAVTFVKNGFENVTLFERDDNTDQDITTESRSINLIYTKRGLELAKLFGLEKEALELAVPVFGNMLFKDGVEPNFQPYGRAEEDCNYSIGRPVINRFWRNVAENCGVKIVYQHNFVDFSEGSLKFKGPSGEEISVSVPKGSLVMGCDGSGSNLRRYGQAKGMWTGVHERLPYGYKVLHIPARNSLTKGESYSQENFALDMKSCLLWSRGEHLLQGLANPDGSFTGTMYMKHDTFEKECSTPESCKKFLDTHYSSALPFLEEADIEAFHSRKPYNLGTLKVDQWCGEAEGSTLCLIGDAAHAILPFFGQGVNCGFEDCLVMNEHLNDDSCSDFLELSKKFFESRKENTDAIADLTKDNFEDIRVRFTDPKFLLKKKIETEIFSRWPELYRSRYMCVMYSRNPYSDCQTWGQHCAEFLEALLEKYNWKTESGEENIQEVFEEHGDEIKGMIISTLHPKADDLGMSLHF